jgi:hypothetical protein
LRIFRRGHERSEWEHLGLLLLLLLLLLLGWAEAAPQLHHSPTSKRPSKEFSPIIKENQTESSREHLNFSQDTEIKARCQR